MYVTLEPCNHWGKTGPCAEALIKAGVGRVVVGVGDPNPRNRKSGGDLLRESGIEYQVGVRGRECEKLVEGFLWKIKYGRPFGVWKYAMTLDGKIATEGGSSKWISGEGSRGWVQQLRRGVDAIIVGGETVRRDNPRLTVREGRRNIEGEDRGLEPMRVVMTRNVELLDTSLRMFDKDSVAEIQTIILTTPVGNGSNCSRLSQAAQTIAALQDQGVVVEQVLDLSPKAAMAYLSSRGALNVLWECGGNLAASALADGCIQKVHAFISPKLVGGCGPVPLAKPPLAMDMKDAWNLRDTEVQTFGTDILLSGYV